MSATTLAELQAPLPHTSWHAEWLVSFGPVPSGPSAVSPGTCWRTGSTQLSIARRDGSDLRVAEDAGLVVLFTGVLTNAGELAPGSTDREAAVIALRLVRDGGMTALSRLRGPFAVVVWKRHDGRVVVARDHIGMEPIYYARAGSTWLLSPSPDALARHPGVSRALDAVAISEWLAGWFPAVEDTTYRDVKRVPPASMLSLPDGAVHRYWDPAATASEPATEEELESFEPLLRRAVSRATHGGAPAIFLSGGVDSIGVAVHLAEGAAERRPLALSLAFPDRVSNEETIQSGVAQALGFEHRLLPFWDAVGSRGLLHEALSLSESWPQPLWNPWAPAYMTLGRDAQAHGCSVILTGRGGDEWLTVTPYVLADYLKRGNVLDAFRYLQMRSRSNGMSVKGAAGLAWTTGCRPLAGAFFDLVAPARWHANRRRRFATLRPSWVAPDPAVWKAVEARFDRSMDAARPPEGFYVREMRTALQHPAVTHDMEETQEFGRRFGLRVLHPFWDVDLIEMLYRVPPSRLMADGRSKALLRHRIAERLPGLGLERRGKVSAAHVFAGVMRQESPDVFARLGGIRTLAEIGAARMDGLESGGHPGRLWTLLTIEQWVRRRA
jgi:asparagine synthase (glutamine-hydrolysing)